MSSDPAGKCPPLGQSEALTGGGRGIEEETRGEERTAAAGGGEDDERTAAAAAAALAFARSFPFAPPLPPSPAAETETADARKGCTLASSALARSSPRDACASTGRSRAKPVGTRQPRTETAPLAAPMESAKGNAAARGGCFEEEEGSHHRRSFSSPSSSSSSSSRSPSSFSFFCQRASRALVPRATSILRCPPRARPISSGRRSLPGGLSETESPATAAVPSRPAAQASSVRRTPRAFGRPEEPRG